MTGIMAGAKTAGKTLLAAVFLLAGNMAAHAAAPVLLTLESAPSGQTRLSVAIRAEGGLTTSPARGQAREKWTLRPGDALTSDVRPDDRVVEFYQASGTQAMLLCAVQVRYFRNPNGQWQPHYLLIEEPLVARTGNRWQPLTTPHGSATLVRHGAILPNAEGFYPALEFGLSIGTTPIDYWQVR